MSRMDTFRSLESSNTAWRGCGDGSGSIRFIGVPIFVEGAVSPADSALLLIGRVRLSAADGIGHFCRRLAAELIPGWISFRLDGCGLVCDPPTDASEEPEILPPGPAPDARREASNQL